MTDNQPKNISQEDVARAVYGYAAGLMRQGKSNWQVEDALVAKGLSKDAAVTIVNNLSKIRTSATRQAALKQMAIGAVICIIGLVVTFGTYSAAASSSKGGSYVVAWGAIIFGGLRFFRALSVYMSG
jgi:hypothetical protein